MADRDQTQGQRGSKKRKTPSTDLHKKASSGQKLRARVEIGCAITAWRSFKEKEELRSDSEVARHLLNAMKKSKSSEKKMKFSQNELQTLIELEVGKALKKNETKLERIAASIQVLNCGVDYESSIQKLEARVKKVTERSEAAIARMTQKKSTQPGDETMSQTDRDGTDWMDMGRDVFQMMKTTKKELKKMRADHDALKASIVDLTEELPLHFRLPGASESMECLRIIKREPEEEEENQVMEFNDVKEPNSVCVKQECSNESEEVKSTRIVHNSEPAAKQTLSAGEKKSSASTCQHLAPDVSPVTPVKERLMIIKQESNSDGNGPLHADIDQDKFPYPPLPATTFPSSMSFEAASYSMPQKVKVHLALIRQPPGLSVLWTIEKEDPSPPPMETYSVFTSMEHVKGSGVFSEWQRQGLVPATPLPMCVMIKFTPGRTICVAVVGKDKFGRFGPYSDVVTAVLPE